jgi:hypothetical protein
MPLVILLSVLALGSIEEATLEKDDNIDPVQLRDTDTACSCRRPLKPSSPTTIQLPYPFPHHHLH